MPAGGVRDPFRGRLHLGLSSRCPGAIIPIFRTIGVSPRRRIESGNERHHHVDRARSGCGGGSAPSGYCDRTPVECRRRRRRKRVRGSGSDRGADCGILSRGRRPICTECRAHRRVAGSRVDERITLLKRPSEAEQGDNGHRIGEVSGGRHVDGLKKRDAPQLQQFGVVGRGLRRLEVFGDE